MLFSETQHGRKPGGRPLLLKNWSLITGLLCLSLVSCKSVGPKTIPPDGFNYNAHIALQKNEQILMNIVRLRYSEVPFFLTVSSVINQYTRNLNTGAGVTNLFGSAGIRADAAGGWSDRPTITYTPLSGRAYSQSILTPLPPATIFFLIQSGWPVDLILRLTATSVNGVMNDIRATQGRRPADPEFYQLVKLLSTMQLAGVLGLDLGGTAESPTVELFFPEPEKIADEEVRNTIAQFKRLLKLAPDSNRFSIRYGLIQNTPNDLVIQAKSMVQVLVAIGWLVEVPLEHVAERRTMSTFRSDSPPLIRILSAKDRPETAFIAIKTKGYWYYIDDRDTESKRAFAIIQILLSLAEDGSQAVGPLISIGN